MREEFSKSLSTLGVSVEVFRKTTAELDIVKRRDIGPIYSKGIWRLIEYIESYLSVLKLAERLSLL